MIRPHDAANDLFGTFSPPLRRLLVQIPVEKSYSLNNSQLPVERKM